MKNLVIIGAGDLGRELVWLIEDINKIKPTYVILGFLDDDPNKQSSKFYGYEVIGTTASLSKYSKTSDVYAVIAIQEGAIRKKIVESNLAFDKWETLVHPSAHIARTVNIGKGCMFFMNSIVSVDSSIGDFSLCYFSSTISNDCEIGKYVSIMSNVSVSEYVKIKDEAYLSAGSSVNPNIVIGASSRVAVGGIVTKDCKDGTLISGTNSILDIFK